MPQPKSGQDKPGRSQVSYPTPDHRDTLLSDALTSDLGDYLSLVAGKDHPDFVGKPDHRLLKEIPIDWQTVQRIYGKDRVAEQLYNAEVAYPEDSKAHPIFTRDFLVRRSDYAPATPLQSQSGIIRGTVTAAGTGYTQETVVATLSGGVGSGGAVTPIVSKTGTIIGLQITAVGHYTIPPALTITDAGSGTGATGAVYIQPKAAVLTNQRIVRMAESPLDSLYFLSRRIYMTLPGPWVPFTRYDLLLGPIQGRRRTVQNTGQVPLLTATTKTTYEGYEGSSHVSYEIEETNSDGTGSAGNPAYPITIDDFYDDVRGAVHQVTQLVADVASAGSLATTAILATLTRYDAYNQFLRRKIVETWVLPGPTITTSRYEPESGIKVTEARTLKQRAQITEANAISGTTDANKVLTVTEIERSSIGAALGIELVTVYPAAAAFDTGTAIVEEEDRPFQYVGRLNFVNTTAGLNIGDAAPTAGVGTYASISKYPANPQAQLTKHTIRTWFVNGLTKPTLTFDEVQPRSIAYADAPDTQAFSFSNVIFDQFTLNFSGTNRTIPATVPSFTTYFDSWIGNSKIVDGSVKELRRFRWKCVTISVVMR